MIEYDRIDLDEAIDVNKTSSSKKCWLCHYWYFLDKNFNYQKRLCDRCHDISIKAIDMQNIAIIYHGRNAYRVIYYGENAYRFNYMFMSRNDAFNLIKNSSIIDKKGTL